MTPNGRTQRRSAARRWMRSVLLGTAATAAAATAFGGVAGSAVALVALASTLPGELLSSVQTRARLRRDELVARLAHVQVEHTDEAVDARSHDPFSYVGRLLEEYRPAAPSAALALRRLQEALDQVDVRLELTRTRREQWSTAGPPELVGGLARDLYSDSDVKRYGDPANVPRWLPGEPARRALLRVGSVLDDIRLLPSAEIEWAVLTFTLWARALLLVLAPALGALSFAPALDLDAGWPRLLPWAVAVVWAVGTAVIAPRVATLVMAQSPAGLRARRVLLVVELPLALALALTSPGWPAVAFAAGWTNWWQRLSRSPAIPDFSWTRLAVWMAVVGTAQSVGLALATGDLEWWRTAAEVAITMGVVAVIGSAYGAMLPVSVGVGVRVLFGGARHRRLAAEEAQRMIDDIAEAMIGAADELAGLADRGPADVAAEGVLRQAVDSMLPPAAARRRGAPTSLGGVITEALAEAGHDMWVEDPRALAAQERAELAGQAPPVVVFPPDYASGELAGIVLGHDVAATLHRLLVACVVEARGHGIRRVQTIVSGDVGTIRIRIANQRNPAPSRRGRGRGGREIGALAASLPGAAEFFRGPTDRAFVGGRPVGELYGVQFAFTASDTADGARSTRTRL